MQAPSLDPAVLNHLPSGSTFCYASETLLEGRERLISGSPLCPWIAAPGFSGPSGQQPVSSLYSVNVQQAKLLMDWVK